MLFQHSRLRIQPPDRRKLLAVSQFRFAHGGFQCSDRLVIDCNRDREWMAILSPMRKREARRIAESAWRAMQNFGHQRKRFNRARANARKAEADGEAAYVEVTGAAEGSRRKAIGLGDAAAVEAMGLAKAKGYQAQVESLGSGPTAAVALANALAEGKLNVMPEVLVTGGGGAIEGLAATLMNSIRTNGENGSKK